MSNDYPGAIDRLVPRSFMFNSNDVQAIVIHKTGGDATPADVYRTFINSGNPGKSAHYAIGQDGSIWQFVPESLGAGANGIPGPNMEPFWKPLLARYGNLNMCTISIEHCDPSGANDTPLTDRQKTASFDLVAHLCKKYNLPASSIKPHRSIAATTCPGTYPMDELINYVKRGGIMVPRGWHDDGTTLTSDNGGEATQGFRQYILNYPGGWNPTNQILGTEFHADILEYRNPSAGGGQKLCCVDSTLGYTKARGVFKLTQGEEIYALLQILKKQPTTAPAIDLAGLIALIKTINLASSEALAELGVSA